MRQQALRFFVSILILASVVITPERVAAQSLLSASVGQAVSAFQGGLQDLAFNIFQGFSALRKIVAAFFPQNVAQVSGSLSNGLLGYWAFDEGTGTVAGDSSSNGNSGTLVNGVSWVSGTFGQALSFGGVSSYVSVPKQIISNLPAYTVALWFKTSATTQQDLYSEGSGTNNIPMFRVMINRSKSGQIGFEHRSDASPLVSGQVTASVNDGVWHHLAIVRTSDTSWQIYLDGALKTTVSGTAGGTSATKSCFGTLCRTSNSNFYVGSIDDARVYGRALSAAEISSLMSSTSVTPPPANPPTDTTAPSVPSGLSTTLISTSQITLSWQASTDDVAVLGYKIFRGGVLIGTSQGTTYSDSNLTSGTQYIYTVAAYDTVGNVSAQSSGLTVSTLVATTSTPPPATTNVFYVSPTGSASGNGSLSNPWDLQTALNQPAAVLPGATIYLRGGIYTHTPQGVSNGQQGYVFKSVLTGTAAKPIVVRSYPGEWAIIDGGAYSGVVGGLDWGAYANARPTVSVYGAYTWFEDLEFTSLSSESRQAIDDSSFPANITRSDGPSFYTLGHKIINCILHDNTTGISAWGGSGGFEAYGNLAYNNGYQGTVHSHGHNVYTQNFLTSPQKNFTNNIFINPFDANVQAYGSGTSEAAHYRFNANTAVSGQVLIGGKSTAQLQDDQFNNGYLYLSDLRLIYGLGPNYKDITADSNYLVDGKIQLGSWQTANITNNTVVTTKAGQIIDIVPTTVGESYTWNFGGNNYFSSSNVSNFVIEGDGFYNFPNWKTRVSSDTTSSYTVGKPTVNKIVVQPNQYDSGRGNIIIYNWTNAGSVNVDISSLGWASGTTYELRSAQDYFVDRVSGTYNGSPISINMNASAHSIAIPRGWSSALGPNTFPFFGAFIIVKTSGGTVTPPPPPPSPPPLPNNPPVVSLTSPGNNTSVSSPATITLTAAASDTDGSIASVSFYTNGTLLGTNTTGPYTFSWTGVPVGTYSITAKAIDNSGAVTNSSAVSITVTTPPVVLDTAAPSTPSGIIGTPLSQSQINLTWQASTDNVGVVGYKIFRNGVQVGAVPGTVYLDSGLTTGTAYTYTVSAYDGSGNTSAQSLGTVVTIQPTVITSTNKFQINDRVQTTAQVNVRSSAGGKIKGRQQSGSFGTVIGGPVKKSGYTWWNVNYDIGIDGWSTENFLKLVVP